MKNMKFVVHISTSDRIGGAAIAAWRLHEGMRDLGLKTRIVCRHPSALTSDVSGVASSLFQVLDLFHQRLVIPAQPEGATLFSLSPVSLSLLDHPWIAAADVIHLHWVAQFIAPEAIAELCKAGKTVFWTFHDQWPYTGGCHYIGGSTRNETDWDGRAQIGESVHEFARLEFQRKKQLFKNLPIHVIAPSRWMAEEAVASGVFRQEQVHVIPYGINTSVFRPTQFQPNLPLDSPNPVNLLFGCQWLGDPRKGYNEFRQALIICMLDTNFAAAVAAGLICVKTFGGIPETGIDLPIPVIHLGTLAGELKVAEAFRAASAFVCPTLEDNLPNVVMESLACGCPVVAFATGGVPDMVIHEKNGLLAPQGNIEALSRHLIDFCLDAKLRQRLTDNTRETDLENYSLEIQATRILELYEAVNPTQVRLNDNIVQDCIPSLEINAKILPHFSTKITLMLLEVKDQLVARAATESLESNTKLINAWEQIATLTENLSEIQQLLLSVQRQQTQSDEEQKLLNLKLRRANNELEAYFSDNRRLTKLLTEARRLEQHERQKGEKIKRQLSYRIGSTLVTKSRSFRSLLYLPLSLAREVNQYQKNSKNKINQEEKNPKSSNTPKIANYQNKTSSNNAAVERIKQQLSYRIGNAFVRNSRSPLGWIKLPFAIFREIIAFKKTSLKSIQNKK